MICGDLKIICMLLEQQVGYRKFPCVLCDKDSKVMNMPWSHERSPSRSSLKNVLHKSFLDPKELLLPPPHIKRGLMKRFVKTLLRERVPWSFGHQD